jgi:hypothetical protein
MQLDESAGKDISLTVVGHYGVMESKGHLHKLNDQLNNRASYPVNYLWLKLFIIHIRTSDGFACMCMHVHIIWIVPNMMDMGRKDTQFLEASTTTPLSTSQSANPCQVQHLIFT